MMRPLQRLGRVTMFVLNDMRLDSRVRRQASTLSRAGWDVTVYAVLSDATASTPRESVDGYRIIRMRMFARPTTSIADGHTRARMAGPLGVRRMLAAAFDRTRPLLGGTLHLLANWQLRWRSWGRRVLADVRPSDVWHAHDLNTLGLALRCADRHGGRVVYDSHEIFTEAGAMSLLPASVRATMRWLERRMVRRVAAVITVNNAIAEHLRDRLGVDEIAVVHNCAEAPRARISPLRAAIGVDGNVPVVMYHGSLTLGRGIGQLIESMTDPRLARAHLVIMGWGPLRPDLQALAEATGPSGRVHFLPPVPPAEVTTWVAGADVAAMPIEPNTLNHRLSSPNKLFEAIAAGVPVVGPSFVEFRHIVGQGDDALGRLHAEHTPRALADAIHSVLAAPPSARQALRARCRRAAAARWSWPRESRHLHATYASMLDGSRSAHPVAVAARGIVYW